MNLDDCPGRPRSLAEIDRWKAVEFRQLLLYTGPVVLRGILSRQVMNHFMLLSVGISLLAHPDLYLSCNEYAHELLKSFIAQSASIYGPEFVVYNVHGLQHLAADAKMHGCLDASISFPFENKLKFVKHLVRKPEVPLSQVVRRLSESEVVHKCSETENLPYTLSLEHCSGPVSPGVVYLHQYRKHKKKSMIIR